MRFFFYGTLIAENRNAVTQTLHTKLHPLGPAMARGRLYAVPDPQGWYPALLPGHGTVHGMLYEAMADFGAAILARIDAYEDFDPTRVTESLYIRRAITVTGTDGAKDNAQAYLFRQPLPRNSRPIRGGDFSAWLAKSGLQPFRDMRAG